tara:strand:- start:3376 stop:3768 length:393 start_codon:yes stop_codon:yes gene_type:complete
MDSYSGMREVFCGAIKAGYETVNDMVLKNDDAESASDFLEMTGMETWELMSQEFKLRSLKKVYDTRETIDLAKAEPHLQAAALWLLIDFQTTICPWSSLDYSWFWGDVVEGESKNEDIVDYIEEYAEVIS